MLETCQNCGMEKIITAKRLGFCERCMQKRRSDRKNKPIKTDIEFKHRGAFSELFACSWLIEKGYEVFRNVSSHGEADLVAWILGDPKPTFIDVTTAIVSINTKGERLINYAKSKDKNDYGIKVIVVDIVDKKCYWSNDINNKNK